MAELRPEFMMRFYDAAAMLPDVMPHKEACEVHCMPELSFLDFPFPSWLPREYYVEVGPGVSFGNEEELDSPLIRISPKDARLLERLYLRGLLPKKRQTA
jgi:hypothetical protein